MLQDDFSYFQGIRESLLQDHLNEFVVIKEKTIIGFFKSEEEALRSMTKEKLGTFLVQKVIPAKDDMIQFFSTRVSFA